MKPCNKCGVPKDDEEFGMDRGKRRNTCKACDVLRVTAARRRKQGTPKVRGRKPKALTVIVDYNRDMIKVNSRAWQLSALDLYQRGETPLLLAAYRARGHRVKEVGR